MRRESKTIVLGERSWTVRPLTLAQLQDIEGVQARYGKGELSNVAYSAHVISISIARDNPDDAKLVLDMTSIETTIAELSEASSVVLRLGGYLPEEGPGESEAGKAAPSTGDGSTPAS